MRAISLGYHDLTEHGSVSNIPSLAQSRRYAVSDREFRRQLETMRNRYQLRPSLIHPVSPKWSGATPLFITFDDGTLGAYKIGASELERLGWRGHFFIVTDWIGRRGFVDKQQIRDLHNRGHVIGSHTCSHPVSMSRLRPEQLLHEWRDSCQALSDILGIRVETASVANGYCSSAVAHSAANAGIRVLFNSSPSTRAFEVENCTVLGRYAVLFNTSAEAVAGMAFGKPLPRFKQFATWYARSVAKTVLGQSYEVVRRQALSR